MNSSSRAWAPQNHTGLGCKRNSKLVWVQTWNDKNSSLQTSWYGSVTYFLWYSFWIWRFTVQDFLFNQTKGLIWWALNEELKSEAVHCIPGGFWFRLVEGFVWWALNGGLKCDTWFGSVYLGVESVTFQNSLTPLFSWLSDYKHHQQCLCWFQIFVVLFLLFSNHIVFITARSLCVQSACTLR